MEMTTITCSGDAQATCIECTVTSAGKVCRCTTPQQQGALPARRHKVLHPQPARNSIAHRGPHPGGELQAHADDAKEEEALRFNKVGQMVGSGSSGMPRPKPAQYFTAVGGRRQSSTAGLDAGCAMHPSAPGWRWMKPCGTPAGVQHGTDAYEEQDRAAGHLGRQAGCRQGLPCAEACPSGASST